LPDASTDLVARHPPHLQTEGDVLVDSHMGKKSIVLEYEAEVATVGR